MQQPSAADLLREARTRAGLSQAALARRARTTQSAISAYEAGSRQPSLPTLRRLVEAAGMRLEVGLEQGSEDERTPLAERVRARRAEVTSLAERHGVEVVALFGSAARGDDTERSDVDLLVRVGPETGLLALAALERELTALLGAPVDLVPVDGLKPRVRDDVLRDAVPL